MIVMKFGGSSVADASKMHHIAHIIQTFSKDDHILVVVSAMAGVTDTLIDIFKTYAEKQTEKASEKMMTFYNLHMQAVAGLALSQKQHQTLEACIHDHFKNLQEYLASCKDFSDSEYAYVVSFGERLSSCLVTAALEELGEKAQAVDASKLIVASGSPLDGKADIDETRQQAVNMLTPLFENHIIPVVTGFFAATKEGDIVTLGRGGSDYSATILAYALDAKEVILWKEVDGVYTDDPKKDVSAKFYPQLSYQEALDLAQKGAKVLHPEAMKPVADKKIVVWVKNTFKPTQAGTKIWIEE